jgi:hypothetical protein
MALPLGEISHRMGEVHCMELRDAELTQGIVPVPLKLFPVLVRGHKASDGHGTLVVRTTLVIVGGKHHTILRLLRLLEQMGLLLRL